MELTVVQLADRPQYLPAGASLMSSYLLITDTVLIETLARRATSFKPAIASPAYREL